MAVRAYAENGHSSTKSSPLPCETSTVEANAQNEHDTRQAQTKRVHTEQYAERSLPN